MDLITLNVLAAIEIMNYKLEDYDNIIFVKNEFSFQSRIGFNPTTDIADAFAVVEKMQRDGFAWKIQMNNLAGEIEVTLGTGYFCHVELPLAITCAALKHYKIPFEL